MSTAPLSDPQSMPIADLKQAAFGAPSDPPAQTQPTPEPTPAAAPAPTPAPPPDPYKWEKQADGSYYVKLDTGEEFRGTADEILPKLAKSKFDSSSYAKQLKAQLDASAAAQHQPAPAAPAEPPKQPTQEEIEAQRTREWLIAETAAGLGMSPEEFVAKMKKTFQTTETMAVNTEIAEFHRICPNYVDTEQNSQILAEYIGNIDHFPTAVEMKRAYAEAVLDGKIQPGTAPSQQPKPPVPPPMPGSTSSLPGGQNPWTMDKNELKKLAFGQ